MAIQAGMYKGRGVEGSVQYGTTKNGHDQIVLDLQLSGTNEVVSTFLIFSEAAAPYSMKRLRALGWKGRTPDDLANIKGISSEEVDVSVYFEEHNGKQQMKVDIVTGGTVVLKDQMDTRGRKLFGQRFARLIESSLDATPPARNGAPARQPGDEGDEAPF